MNKIYRNKITIMSLVLENYSKVEYEKLTTDSVGISPTEQGSCNHVHPIASIKQYPKLLYHEYVGGARYENMYRGKKLTINGNCEVNIDSECNSTGGMIDGTFVSINKNCQLYLQNNQTYDRVKGSIYDNKISIQCQNITDQIEIEWLVIGERHVIDDPITDNNGNLKCEHDM